MPRRLRSLHDVLTAAEERIENPVLRNLVITRIFIRSGVNLREIRPEQNDNPPIVDEIVQTFEELGYSLAGVNS